MSASSVALKKQVLLFDADFIEISTSVVRRIVGPLPFDVFIKRAENTYTKLFPSAEPVDLARLDNYEINRGVQTLQVHKNDYRKYLFYAEQVANKIFEFPKSFPDDDFVDAIKDMTNLTMLELIVNHNVDQATVMYAAQTVRGCLEAIMNDKRALVKIFRLFKAHPYLMRHSILTSLCSILLAREAKLESDKTLMAIGLGGLLHDIGMTRLSFDAEEKDDLTPQEWKELKEHPEAGKRLLDSIKSVPLETKMMVLQHHEQPNGLGYPNGYHDKSIYYPAKIVAIADSFSALISKRPFREAFRPIDAIEVMMEDRGKFDQKLLDLFCKFFVRVKAA